MSAQSQLVSTDGLSSGLCGLSADLSTFISWLIIMDCLFSLWLPATVLYINCL